MGRVVGWSARDGASQAALPLLSLKKMAEALISPSLSTHTHARTHTHTHTHTHTATSQCTLEHTNTYTRAHTQTHTINGSHSVAVGPSSLVQGRSAPPIACLKWTLSRDY